MSPFPVQRRGGKPTNGIALATAGDSVLVAWADGTLRWTRAADLTWGPFALSSWPLSPEFTAEAWPQPVPEP